MSPGGDSAIDGTQQRPDARKIRDKNQRPAPNCFPRKQEDCVGTPGSLTALNDDAHLGDRTVARNPKRFVRDRALKGSGPKMEAGKNRPETASERDAKGTGAIVEEPASAAAGLAGPI